MSSLTDNEDICQANGESEIEVLLGHALADCNDCLNRGDFQGALKLLDRAIDLSPGNPEILTHRGRLLVFLKEFDRARADFEEALQADPRSSATNSGLARCHFEKRAYDLARTCATHARTMDPANQEAGEVLSALEKITRITDRPVSANASVPAQYEGHRGKLFAKTDPQFSEDLLTGLRGRRLAIIGNATVTREFGSLIDTYDAVIRLNNFRLAGFERIVGARTDFRCTTGFTDIEHRNEHPEFSPFRDNALESIHLAAFNRANARPVLSAQLDVHPCIPETRNPSTGLALVQLCAQLGLSADLFGFDGFKSPHYWQLDANFRTTHSRHELAIILRRPNVILFGETYPYAALYDFCHANHRDYDDNVGLKLLHRLGRTFRGKTILEFGAGNGELSRYLEAQTNRVTAVEVSGHAFAKIQCTRKIHGDAFTLALLREHFDVFASVDVLEHLTENDIRLVLREAGRLADSLFLSVSTRPSGLLGPNGENLHLTVRPAQWWVEEAGRYFDVRLSNGYGTGQIVLEGRVKSHRPAAEFENLPQTEPSPAKIDLDTGLTLEIGAHSYIHDNKIRNPSGALTDITVGRFCCIATGLTVIGYDHHSEWAAMYPFLDDGHRANWPGTSGIPYPESARFGSNKSRGDIEIGNDVWIGSDVKLFKGIIVGNGAVIGACSLVNKSVEPYTIVAGIPARPIRKRFSDVEINLLQKIQWWNLPASLINRYMPLLCSSNIAELEQTLEADPDFQVFKRGDGVTEPAVNIRYHVEPSGTPLAPP